MVVREAIQTEFKTLLQLGENGTLEYTDDGVGSDLLALSQLVRGGEPQELVDRIVTHGSAKDVLDLVVLIFATRNTRGGKGEKQLAYDIFLRVYYKTLPDTTMFELLTLFPHYGYWKDLLHLIKVIKERPAVPKFKKDAFFNAAVKIMADQLVMDMKELQRCKESSNEIPPSISLLVKWLPRENSSLDKKTGVVNALAAALFASAAVGGASSASSLGVWQSRSKRLYRKTVSQLTAELSLPEVLLASHREEEIQFGRVASRATMVLRRVFMNQDKKGNQRSDKPERIAMADRFVEHVLEKGLKGSQLMPHEIVAKVMSNGNISEFEELVLDAQWKSLRESVVAQIQQTAQETGAGMEPTRLVPLSDVSGSMIGTPMEVSIALGILLSEITHPAFRGMVLTFESTPRWHLLGSSDTIVQKVRSLQAAPWGGSTDFAAAYRLILKVARDNKLQRADMPSMIVFSDMQFDQAQHAPRALMHDLLKQDFKSTAEALGWQDADPTPIVYWNLRNTRGHPVDRDTEGAVLLSGFSPSLLKLVMAGNALEEVEVEVVDVDGNVTTEKVRVTPEAILRKMLDDELYDPVRRIMATSRARRPLNIPDYSHSVDGGVVNERKIEATASMSQGACGHISQIQGPRSYADVVKSNAGI